MRRPSPPSAAPSRRSLGPREISAQAERLKGPTSHSVGTAYSVRVVECQSQIGSGALPIEVLASAAIAIAPVERKRAGSRLEALAGAMRGLPTPVIGRIANGALVLDLRCLGDDEPEFVAQVTQLPRRLAEGVSDAAS